MKKYSTTKPKVNVVQDPSVVYGFQNNNFDTIRWILGGDKVIKYPINNEIDLMNLSRVGLKKSAIVSVSEFLNISMEKMSTILNISLRTIQRKGNNELLSSASSGLAIEVAEVISKGLEIFGTKENFNVWINTPLQSLGAKTPLSMLDTTIGTKYILKELGRLEHGVYS